MVGELRDLGTVALALETAITGHLVFGALHTSSAMQTGRIYGQRLMNDALVARLQAT